MSRQNSNQTEVINLDDTHVSDSGLYPVSVTLYGRFKRGKILLEDALFLIQSLNIFGVLIKCLLCFRGKCSGVL